jgi:hypothetical protein
MEANMQSKSIKTLSAILVVLVLSTLSCDFSFDLGGKKDDTATPEIQQVTSAPVEQAVQPTREQVFTDEPVAESQPYYMVGSGISTPMLRPWILATYGFIMVAPEILTWV